MEELRAHLVRLAIWSGLSLIGGLLLLTRRPPELLRGLAILTIGWAVVNLAIAFFSWRGSPPTEMRALREFLMLNLGLNVGYIGVGVTMAILGSPFVRGAGIAVAIQGFALLVLDGYLMAKLPK